MEDVLNGLANEGLVDVRDKTGTTTRQGRIQRPSDIIIPNPQKRLYFT
jgi:hypothetical protein